MQYEFHEACTALPPLSAEELDSLRASMRQHGYMARFPVLLCDGKILDGRHRYQIATELGLTPAFDRYTGNPWALVKDVQAARRSFTSDIQRAAILAPLVENSDAWERAKAEREAAANAARSEAAKEQHATSNPRAGEKSGSPTDGGSTKTSADKNKGETNMAAATGTNRGAVAKAKAMHNLATRLGVLDVFQLFKDGKINAADCDRTLRGVDRARGLIAQVAHKLSDQPQLQQEWLDSANDRMDMGALQSLRIAIEARKPQEVIEAPRLPGLVLADPPWRYDFAETDSRQIENQYPSATVGEIIAHKPVTEGDCVLLMWATVAKMREAFEVMDGWGFEYKTHAVWDKEKIGMGYWFRGQHELLLVGTKGKVSPPAPEHRVSSVFREARRAHSEKPDCVYEWIEAAFPHLLKLEMYCRRPREGWLVFGNESVA